MLKNSSMKKPGRADAKKFLQLKMLGRPGKQKKKKKITENA